LKLGHIEIIYGVVFTIVGAFIGGLVVPSDFGIRLDPVMPPVPLSKYEALRASNY